MRLPCRFALALCLLLTATPAPGPAPAAGEDPLRVVAARELNVRAGPGTDAQVVSQLAGGTLVYVQERRRGWARVTYEAPGEAENGWVSRRYLVQPDAYSAPETPARDLRACDGRAPDLRVDSRVDDLACASGPLVEGYDACDVVVSVRVHADCRPAHQSSVEVFCEAFLKTRQRGSGFAGGRERGISSDFVDLAASTVERTLTVPVTVNPVIGEPVVEAELASVFCEAYP